MPAEVSRKRTSDQMSAAEESLGKLAHSTNTDGTRRYDAHAVNQM